MHQGCSVNLAWNASTNQDGTPATQPVGYILSWGRASGQYTDQVDVGTATQGTAKGLGLGVYYFAVRAYFVSDASTLSPYSNEVNNGTPFLMSSFEILPGGKAQMRN
jgi:hypothetical protein